MSDFEKFPELNPSIFQASEGTSELVLLLSQRADALADEERSEIVEVFSPSEDVNQPIKKKMTDEVLLSRKYSRPLEIAGFEVGKLAVITAMNLTICSATTH